MISTRIIQKIKCNLWDCDIKAKVFITATCLKRHSNLQSWECLNKVKLFSCKRHEKEVIKTLQGKFIECATDLAINDEN